MQRDYMCTVTYGRPSIRERTCSPLHRLQLMKSLLLIACLNIMIRCIRLITVHEKAIAQHTLKNAVYRIMHNLTQ